MLPVKNTYEHWPALAATIICRLTILWYFSTLYYKKDLIFPYGIIFFFYPLVLINSLIMKLFEEFFLLFLLYLAVAIYLCPSA